VDYEIIMGIGPTIKPPIYKNTTIVLTHDLKLNKSMNLIRKAAHGDILLTTMCDMQVNSPTQLKRMLALYSDKHMVSERFIGKLPDGTRGRTVGTYLQCLMVSAAAIEQAGGWCELYDNPDLAAYEDGDLVASLLEQGLNLELLSTPEEEGVYHIDHEGPDMTDPVYLERCRKGRELFFTRHKEGIMALYAKQFARNMMRQRAIT